MSETAGASDPPGVTSAGGEGRWRKARHLTSPAANGVYVAHEHRRPREPSVVAHLLKVAGAISFSSIVRGRHRSATALSFVLCGVSSASFVRGSHEQDSLLPAGAQRVPHPWRAFGVAVGGAVHRRRQKARRPDRPFGSTPWRGAVVGHHGAGPL